MADDDDGSWRRRIVEERFGDSLTPGFARGGNVNLSGAAPWPTNPAPSRPAADDFRAPPTVRSAPPAQRQPGRSGAIGWAVAAVLAVVLAALVGWLARGGDRQIVYLPSWAAALHRDMTQPNSDPAAIESSPTPALPTDVTSNNQAVPPDTTTTLPPIEPATAIPPVAMPRVMIPTPRRKLPTVSVKPARPTRSVLPALAALPCSAGTGPASRLLCADPTLRLFDEQMQLAEARVIAHGAKLLTAEAAKDRAHYLRRREKCTDAACLTRVYSDWIVALVKLLPAGDATPPICLPQQYTRTPIMNCWPSHLRPIRAPFYSK